MVAVLGSRLASPCRSSLGQRLWWAAASSGACFAEAILRASPPQPSAVCESASNRSDAATRILTDHPPMGCARTLEMKALEADRAYANKLAQRMGFGFRFV